MSSITVIFFLEFGIEWMYRVMTTRKVEWVYGVLIARMSLGLPLGVLLVKELHELISKTNWGTRGPQNLECESLDTN